MKQSRVFFSVNPIWISEELIMRDVLLGEVKLSELLKNSTNYQKVDSIPGAFLLTGNEINTLCIGQDPLDWAQINSYTKSNEIPDVMILPGMTSIGRLAFYGCISLTTINIPSSVKSIGEGAFWDCSSLTTINIPSSVTNIEMRAFADCSSLTTINIPSSVTSIGQ